MSITHAHLSVKHWMTNQSISTATPDPPPKPEELAGSAALIPPLLAQVEGDVLEIGYEMISTMPDSCLDQLRITASSHG